LKNPAILQLKEEEDKVKKQLIEYSYECSLDDKYLVLYALIRLKIIPGKSIFL